MKISFNWLAEIIALPSAAAETIAEEMTMRIAEVESAARQQDQYEKITASRIVSVSPHPEADTLRLVELDAGTERVTVVCGAPNLREGMVVPLALPGASVGGTEVRAAVIRGVESPGMIPSERELGLSEDHSGVMELDETVKPGTPLAEALGLDDLILDVDNHAITHRPDLWCHRGMARELAAVYRVRPPRELDLSLMEKGDLEIDIQAPDLCMRYTGAVIENVKIEPSPWPIRKKLIACGVRPINNIVDVTNYVMLELGEPMHAFDADKVAGNRIIVRRAAEGETIVTLDGEERKLTPDDLVIADEEKAVALAGVMGGENTEITPATTRIILEAATFHPVNIRNTRRRTGLQSEATNRFEKGLPPEITAAAVNRACDLIKELLPSAAVTAVVDTDFQGSPEKKIHLSERNIKRLIGVDISIADSCKLLTSLGFASFLEEDRAVVTVPYWRNRDVNIEADLIEDISRLYGLEKIQPRLPALPNKPAFQSPLRLLEKKLRNILAGGGADEVSTYSFCPDDILRHFSFAAEPHFELRNPLDVNMRRMRRSLLPGLLAVCIKNMPWFEHFAVYEIGRVYHPNTMEEEQLTANERHMLTLLVYRKNSPSTYHEARAFAALVCDAFSIPFDLQRDESIPDMHPARSARIVSGDAAPGYVAELHPRICRKMKIRERIGIVEIALDELVLLAGKHAPRYVPPPLYPAVNREFSMIAPRELDFAAIRDTVLPLDARIREVELLSVYTGKPIEEGKKSVSFRVTLRDDAKTMSDEEANEVQERIIATCAHVLGLRLREK